MDMTSKVRHDIVEHISPDASACEIGLWRAPCCKDIASNRLACEEFISLYKNQYSKKLDEIGINFIP